MNPSDRDRDRDPIQRQTHPRRPRRRSPGLPTRSDRPVPGQSLRASQLAQDLAALVEHGLIVPVEQEGVLRYAVAGEAE